MELIMKYIVYILFLCPLFGISQMDVAPTEIDSLYREDQFYIGLTYNLVGNKPVGFSQNGFSLGFNMGFVRDMPINKKRNLALGIGLGYATNSFNQNILITKTASGSYNYSTLNDAQSFSKNKFSNQLIEVPIEFRWRTSTATTYSFWRIYTGLRIGYVFYNTVKYKGDQGEFKHINVSDFNEFQYGLTLSVGYNTWNLHLNYSLNSIFNDQAEIDGKPIDMNTIKLGLIFFIL
ncbi:porin family protein [Gaetbulibacter sp. M240]|uniref:porin family protein n=1 Tax=Gaetbulibacter sp. M240 TaxID=3126511 RepID=UPI00374E466C